MLLKAFRVNVILVQKNNSCFNSELLFWDKIKMVFLFTSEQLYKKFNADVTSDVASNNLTCPLVMYLLK